MDYTKEQKINMIWQQKHSDFRGMLGSDKSIMINASDGGGIEAICNFSDVMLDEYFDRAMKSSERKENRQFAKALFEKHGATELLGEGTINQWCSDLNGIREVIELSDTVSEQVKSEMIKDINRVDNPEPQLNTEPSL